MPQEESLAKKSPIPQRIDYLSLIRVISCIGIVALHTYYVFISYFETSQGQRFVSFAVRNAMMWAVPCFVMVTGALLLEPSREVTIKKLFTKYISRAALAILVFTLVFYLFDLWMSATLPRLSDMTAILGQLYGDGSWSHMWYLYMLIGLYLLMPAFRLVTAGAGDAVMRYLLLIGALFLILLPNIDAIFGLKAGLYISVYTVYPFYLFLGYALHKGILKIKRPAAAGMLAVSLIVIVILTAVQMRQGSAVLQKLLGNYSFIAVALASSGLFALLKPKEAAAEDNESDAEAENEQNAKASPNRKDQKKTGKKEAGLIALHFMDQHSFGIYLLHFMVLKFAVVILQLDPYKAGGNLLLIVVTMLVFAVSLLLTFLLRLIPGVKKIL